MANSLRNVPVSRGLHPKIYGLLVGSVSGIIVAVWVFFSGNTYTEIQLSITTVFGIAFVATPYALWRLSGKRNEEDQSLRAWCNSELDTYTGKVHGTHAAVMVLLAPMACAVGMTGISFIAWLMR